MQSVPSTSGPAADSSMSWLCCKCGSCNTTHPQCCCHVKHGRLGWHQSLLYELQRKGAPQSSPTAVVVLLPTKNTHPNVVPTCNHKGKRPHREMQKKRRSTTAHASDDVELPPSSLPSLSLPLLLSEQTSNPKPFFVPRFLPRPPLHQPSSQPPPLLTLTECQGVHEGFFWAGTSHTWKFIDKHCSNGCAMG